MEQALGVFKVALSGKTIGTAFLYNLNHKGKQWQFFLTAAHVMKGLDQQLDKITITNNLGTFKVRDFVLLRSRDSAFIQVEGECDSLRQSRGFVSFGNSMATTYSTIQSFHYTVLEPAIRSELLLSEGRLQYIDLQAEQMLLSTDLVGKGSSGAPVFLAANRKVLGMGVQQVVQQSTNLSMGVLDAVPIDAIDDALDAFLALGASSYRLCWQPPSNPITKPGATPPQKERSGGSK